MSTRKSSVLVFLNLFLFILALFLASGCSSSKPKRRGVKLSDAAEEAKKKPEDQKPLAKKKKKGEKDEPIVHDDDDDDGVGIGFGFDSDRDDAADQDRFAPAREKEPIHLGVVLGGGSLGNNELDGFALLGIQLGPDFFNERLRLDIRGLIMPTNQSEKAQFASGLDDEIEVAADLGGRFYFTPRHTFMGLYTHLGLRVGHLSWDYKNPIQVTGTGGQTETIDSDGVNFFAVFGGFGVGLAQFRKVHIGVNLSFGYKSYGEITSEGFDNDVFSDEPFTQLMLEFTSFVDWF